MSSSLHFNEGGGLELEYTIRHEIDIQESFSLMQNLHLEDDIHLKDLFKWSNYVLLLVYNNSKDKWANMC